MQSHFKNYNGRPDKNMHQQIRLTDDMVNMTFHCLCEGILSQIKKGLSNIGNNVDVTSLIRAWEAAGSPHDSEKLVKFLIDSGIDEQDIEKVYTAIGIPFTQASSSLPTTPAQPKQAGPVDEIKGEIEKLTIQQQQQLMLYLTSGNTVDLSKIKTEISNLDIQYQKKLLSYMQNQEV